MENIMLAENHTFDLFKKYYQNIRDAVTRDEKGRYIDPFGHHVRSFKTDEFGRLQSVYVRPDYGSNHIVLYGSPDGIFNVQGSNFEDMYAYIFDHGALVEERISNRSGYFQRKYSLNSNGHPVAQVRIPHGGGLEEKRWSDDGKILIYKKTQTMDEDCLEKITTEFLDKKGRHRLMIDWRQYGRCCETEMYDVTRNGNKLLWLRERDPKGNYCVYDGHGKLLYAVTDKNGKRQGIRVAPQPNQATR